MTNILKVEISAINASHPSVIAKLAEMIASHWITVAGCLNVSYTNVTANLPGGSTLVDQSRVFLQLAGNHTVGAFMQALKDAHCNSYATNFQAMLVAAMRDPPQHTPLVPLHTATLHTAPMHTAPNPCATVHDYELDNALSNRPLSYARLLELLRSYNYTITLIPVGH